MISFIVPAHNEEALLGRTLTAIHGAARVLGEPYEVVVVDDSSTDRTGEVAWEHQARLIRVEHRQIAATRNAGARAARGEIFFFVDADTLPTPAAVAAGVAALARGAAGGGCLIRFDGELPRWAERVLPIFLALARVSKFVGGCFLFCTRAGFEAVGGFSERYFAAEELVFIRALKRHGRIVVPRPTVVTSGRKLRAFSARELLTPLLRFALRPSAFHRREGLDVWYGERRAE